MISKRYYDDIKKNIGDVIMKRKSSSSPAIAFIGFSIFAIAAIAIGFLLGGETGYAITTFAVAAAVLIIGLIELLENRVIHPLINFLITVFPDSEDDTVD